MFHSFYEISSKLSDEQEMLLDSLYNDYDADVNDAIRLYRIDGWNRLIVEKIFNVWKLCELICIMENEKDGFEIQKTIKEESESLQEYLESRIKLCRTGNFVDYRCIDWVKRVTKWMEKIKEEMFEE